MDAATALDAIRTKRAELDACDQRASDLRTERNALWQTARDAGCTAEVIAKAAGVNKSRVHQVIGVPKGGRS